jgi:hypothetical protein
MARVALMNFSFNTIVSASRGGLCKMLEEMW